MNNQKKKLGFLPATPYSHANSVSILQSRREIDDLQITARQNASNPTASVTNRQINSGMIIDWKEFENNPKLKSQLLLKDGQNDESVIFSYIVEEWAGAQPNKVCYRWKRNFKRQQEHPCLLEEQHIFRGHMLELRKHGKGQYLIVKRYSDNSEKQQCIRGTWNNDILSEGTVTDEQGKEKTIQKTILSLKSKRTAQHLTTRKGKGVLSRCDIERDSQKSIDSLLQKPNKKNHLPPLNKK